MKALIRRDNAAYSLGGRNAENLDRRTEAAYTVAEAARYLRLPSQTLRSWTNSGPRFWPLIEPAGRWPTYLSFFNLIEAHFLRSLRVQHRANLLEEYLARVEWDEWILPVRLYPFIPGAAYSVRSIAIDPRIAFGRPVVARAGVSTGAIASRIGAREPVSEVAADYDLTVEEVEQAELYERAA